MAFAEAVELIGDLLQPEEQHEVAFEQPLDMQADPRRQIARLQAAAERRVMRGE